MATLKGEDTMASVEAPSGPALERSGRGSTPIESHCGVFGAPPILVYFSGDWDVHCMKVRGFDP